MKVLGLNGWPDGGHDASACLLLDGKIDSFVEEERFVREKHAYGRPPIHAAAYCLSHAGLTLDDIDAVAFGWDPAELLRRRRPLWRMTKDAILEQLLPESVFPRSRALDFVPVRHHLAHAASTAYFGGCDRGAVLVLDGQGENESASIGRFADGRVIITETIPIGWSLGYFYSAVSRYIGLGIDDPGKLMGLAAYGTVSEVTFGSFDFGKPRYEVRHMPQDMIVEDTPGEEEAVVARWEELFASVLPLPPNKVRTIYDPSSARLVRVPAVDPFAYRDVAATAQAALEQAVHNLVGYVLATTGEKTLLLAGGVGYNASLNGKLLRHPGLDRLFVQPIAGDAGVSLGAAAVVSAQRGKRIAPLGQTLAYGPTFEADSVRAVLERWGPFEEPADLERETARLLDEGKVVGWMSGRAEAGPRALGHRSMLALPEHRRTRDRINLELKRREWWRPLAPSIARHAAGEFVDADVDLPYMVVTVPVLESKRASMEAVLHVDGTTRPHTVHPDEEPVYHRLLEEVAALNGAPVVLNTSFNGQGEPVVLSPSDACAAAHRMGLDALVIAPYLVRLQR